MLGAFALHRRSQHAAASADDSASIVAFDLWIALPDEKQARHVTMMENPLEAARFVGELGQPASRDKLLLAKDGPVVIAAGAVGSKEQGESLAGGNTNTRIEMLDTGEVEVISDQEDAKIFQFTGTKLTGRMLFARDGDSKRFNITNESVSSDGSGGGDSTDGTDASGGDGTGSEDGDAEDKNINDPESRLVESFITPELDEVLVSIIETSNISDDIAERMRAIRQSLSEKKITKRDIAFILRYISGGEALARQSIEEELADDELLLLSSPDFLNSPFTVTSDNYAPFEVIPDGNGQFTIPKLEFIKPGRWGGHDFTFDDSNIGQIKKNFAELSKTEIMDVPTKIGHHKNQALRGNLGELANGWVTDVWNEPHDDGLHGFMKITDIPSSLALLIKNKRLKNRSAEFFKNVEYNGKEYGLALKAISFLGTTTPAVLGMQTGVHDGVAGVDGVEVDSAVASYSLDGKEVIIANLSRSENQMSDAAKVLQLSQAEFDAKVKAAVDQGAKTATEQLQAVFAKDKEDMNKQVLELSQRLKTEQDVRRKETVKAARAGNIVEFDLLVKGGHVLPVQKDEFINLCNALDGVADMAKSRDLSDMLEGMTVNKDTLEFSVKVQDADKQVDFTGGIKAMFFKMLRSQKQIALGTQTLDLTRKTTATGANAGAGTAVGAKAKSDQILELTAKIQDEKKIPYADALSLAVKQVHGDKAADAMIDGLSSTEDSEE